MLFYTWMLNLIIAIWNLPWIYSFAVSAVFTSMLTFNLVFLPDGLGIMIDVGTIK